MSSWNIIPWLANCRWLAQCDCVVQRTWRKALKPWPWAELEHSYSFHTSTTDNYSKSSWCMNTFWVCPGVKYQPTNHKNWCNYCPSRTFYPRQRLLLPFHNHALSLQCLLHTHVWHAHNRCHDRTTTGATPTKTHQTCQYIAALTRALSYSAVADSRGCRGAR